jgi:hypothetical protein
MHLLRIVYIIVLSLFSTKIIATDIISSDNYSTPNIKTIINGYTSSKSWSNKKGSILVYIIPNPDTAYINCTCPICQKCYPKDISRLEVFCWDEKQQLYVKKQYQCRTKDTYFCRHSIRTIWGDSLLDNQFPIWVEVLTK